MSDILDVTESQAKVLRAIAYCEVELGMKGATQYSCFRKVPKSAHVSGSTFNDNIHGLEEKMMVTHLEIGTGDRESKPYSITYIGHIAWLRYFPISENLERISNIFPNLKLSAIDDIINQIDHPDMKYLKNKFASRILRIALNNLHINISSDSLVTPMMIFVEERMELPVFQGLKKISFTRNFFVNNYSSQRKLIEKNESRILFINLDELNIKLTDRITFLFYYYLIQSLSKLSLSSILTESVGIEKNEFININRKGIKILPTAVINEYLNVTNKLLGLRLEIINKKRKILKEFYTNEKVYQIIQNNLKDLQKERDLGFQEIFNMFKKTNRS